MLTSGMVPALYADDEKEQIIGQVSRNLNSVFYMIPRNFMLHHNQGFFYIDIDCIDFKILTLTLQKTTTKSQLKFFSHCYLCAFSLCFLVEDFLHIM